MQRYSLNVKLLVSLIIGTVFLSGGTYLLHAYQIERNAGTFLERGKQAEEKKDLRSAANLYSRYLNYAKLEDEERNEMDLKIANLLLDVALDEDTKRDRETYGKDARAVLNKLPRTIGNNKNNAKLRSRYIEFSKKINDWQVVLSNLDLLLEQHPDNQEYMADRLEALVRLNKNDEALKYGYELLGYNRATATFDVSKAKAPEITKVYTLVASLIQQSTRDSVAVNRVINQMIQVVPDDFNAQLIYGRHLRSQGKKEEAEAAILKAAELNPDDRNVIYELAIQKLPDPNETDKEKISTALEEAKKILEKGIERHPKTYLFYLQLARIEMVLKNKDAAFAILEKGIKAGAAPSRLLYTKAIYQASTENAVAIRRTKKRLALIPNLNKPILDFVEGLALFKEGKWQKTIDQFLKLRPQMAGTTQSADIDRYLAQSYERLGMNDKAIEYYKFAYSKKPTDTFSKAAIARMQKRLGKVVKRKGGKTIHELTAEEMKKPKAQRNFAAIDKAIEEEIAKKKLSDAYAQLFRAEAYIARKEYKRARKIVSAVNKQKSNDFWVWLTAAELCLRDPEEGPEKALAILNAMIKRFGDRPLFREKKGMLLLFIHSQKPNKNIVQDLDKLTRNIDDWKVNDQVNVLNTFADYFIRLRKTDKAEECWNRIAKIAPNDLSARMAMFEMARNRRDNAGMQEAQKKILDVVERKEHSSWRYTEAARQLFLFHAYQDKDALKKADELVGKALQDRPSWSRLIRLSAEIAIAQGKSGDAIKAYDLAGEGQANALDIARYAQLLYQKGRFQEARSQIDQLTPGIQARLLGTIAAEIMVRTNSPEKAIELAESLLETRPESVPLHLWYGQLLMKASLLGDKEARVAKAGEAIHKAIELEPNSYTSWMGWIGYLINARKVPEAEQAIREAQLALPSHSLPIVLAESYQIMGRWYDAEQNFIAAMEADPKNLRLCRLAAKFYLGKAYPRKDGIAKATPLINKILRAGVEGKLSQGDSDLLWARSTTAKMLASSKDYQDLLKAEKVIQLNAVNGELNLEDKLQLAMILAPRPEPASKKHAIQLLSEVKQVSKLSVKTSLLLARLYQEVGDWKKAKKQMLDTISVYPDEPAVWDTYTRMLIERKEYKNAAEQLKHYIELKPNTSQAIELQVRVLAGLGQKEKAVTLLGRMMPKRPGLKDMQQVRGIAGMLDQIGEHEQAGKLYEIHFAMAKKMDEAKAKKDGTKNRNVQTSKAILLLARHLAAYGDPNKAIELLGAMWKNGKSSQITQMAISCLRSRRKELGDSKDAVVEEWIKSALREDPESVQFLAQLADLRDIQKNANEAEKLYRKILKLDGVEGRQRGMILNNLSFLLGLKKEDLPEALKMANEAIELFGPTSDMLDTRAVILLGMKDADAAIKDLKLAVIGRPTPSKYFHLTQAYLLKENEAEAKKAWKKAVELGLSEKELSTMEATTYKKLKAKFGE